MDLNWVFPIPCYTPSEAEVFPVPFVEFKDVNLNPEQLTEKSDRAST
ncbi:MAG: hypothetical protein RIB93_11990 [Coleofasciculus sp. D1-CHI-01]